MSDDRLRSVLLELGDVPAPPDLAGAALTRGRRDRRRAIAGLVGLVAILAAAAVTVPAVVMGRPTTSHPATGPITGLMVAGYGSVVDSYNGTIPDVVTEGGWYFPPGGEPTVYNPSRDGFSKPPWRIAVPSPDGRMFAVSDAGTTHTPHGDLQKAGRIGIVPADRIDDPAAVRWVPGSDTYGDLSWEADSRRLAFQPKDTPSEGPGLPVSLIDVSTLHRTTLLLATTRPTGLVGHLPNVPPDGRGFVTTVRLPLPGGGGVTQWILRYYDERGARIREVRIAGTADLPTQVAQPFSADGRLVAMAGGDSTDIVDTASGRVVLPHVNGVFAGWYDQQRFVVWLGRTVRVVDRRTGRVLAQKVLAPAGRKLTNVWLAPVHGDAPPGAIVL